MTRSKTVLFLLVLLTAIGFGSVSAQQQDEPYVIGFLIWFNYESFIDEMTQLGYIEGENVTYMILSYDDLISDPTTPPEAYIESYNQQVQAMIDAQVDVFVTNTDTDAVTLQAMTGGSIPTLFARSDDPVATGAVESLVAPGGVITGVVTNRPHERRLQLLTEIVPTDRVLYLYSPLTGEAETVLEQVRAVGDALDVEIDAIPVVDGPSGIAAFENITEETDWIFLTPYVPFDVAFNEALVEASLSHRIGIASVTDFPTFGHLIGYGPNIDDSNRQTARMVDRVLRGANPAEMPVETAENFLLVNLEAAEALGIEIPLGVLRQARTIIRPGYFEELGTFGG
jgi:putative ABC transport system substrate-binding protein